jgi:hypothetical protein
VTAQQINRVAGRVLIVLPLVALSPIIIGYNQPPETDEGTGAHIFQLSIAAMAPTLVVFLATADWTKPWRCARRLTLPFALLALAFAALYHLEHR